MRDGCVMDGQAKQPKVVLTRVAWWWLGALALALVSVWPLGHFDNATELTPDHSDTLAYCFWAAGIVAVSSALVCFSQSKGSLASRVLMSTLVFGGLGGLATLLLLSTIANIIHNHRDFPPETTQTYWALLPIERAYRADFRTGSSWIIQPAPIWSNIDISHSDYSLMLGRPASGGERSEPSSVSSRSHFCAKVEMQQSGDALRVLQAGTQKLPPGTVGVCSEMVASEPSLPVVR